MELAICATCRKKSPTTCDATPLLVAAARAWAKARRQPLRVVREPCLSGCLQGAMAMVTLPEGIVRFQGVRRAAQLPALLDDAPEIIAGRLCPSSSQVLSRLNWAEWEAQ